MAVASILVSEADPDVRRLLVVLIERLGHAAVVLDSDVEIPPRADLLLLEPSAPECLAHALLARQLFPAMPIICMGFPPPEAGYLFEGPVSFLEKPFTVEALEFAVSAFAYSPI